LYTIPSKFSIEVNYEQYDNRNSSSVLYALNTIAELFSSRSGAFSHQQRLLQAFTEEVFMFSLLVYIAH